MSSLYAMTRVWASGMINLSGQGVLSATSEKAETTLRLLSVLDQLTLQL